VLLNFSTFPLNCLHIYLATHVQSLLFCVASIGGGVEPVRRVAGSHVGPSQPSQSP
jgi:hypothetical protein